MKITTGDAPQVYGSYGIGFDYAVRKSVRMKDAIDGEMLEAALRQTEKRYPYLLTRLCKNESEYFWEENKRPIALLHTKERIHLNHKESNYHAWAVCYFEDWLYFDFYHGLADGAGNTRVLATLLYYYCNLRYGVTEHKGILTLDDPILPEETIDPLDSLPSIDMSKLAPPPFTEAFSPIRDGKINPAPAVNYDIALPEKAFAEFSSANDGSPGIMISLLLDKAIDAVFPERDKDIVTIYIINCRPMLGAIESYHNCISAAALIYSERLKKKPLLVQATIYRGRTFLAAEEDVIKPQMTAMSAHARHILQTNPSIEAKKSVFAGFMEAGSKSQTCMVSYVGKWKYPSVESYIEEFWTHAPKAYDILVELTAVNGKIGLSILQKFADERIIKALFAQFE